MGVTVSYTPCLRAALHFSSRDRDSVLQGAKGSYIMLHGSYRELLTLAWDTMTRRDTLKRFFRKLHIVLYVL